MKIGVEDEKLAVVLEHIERKDWKFNFAKMVSIINRTHPQKESQNTINDDLGQF